MDILKKCYQRNQNVLQDISDVEQNNSKPSYEILIKFCNTFNVGLDDIFKDYLNISKDKIINYELNGYENLKTKDKSTIAHLISFFNKEINGSKQIVNV